MINRYCGSGVEAIAIASARIHAGQADVIIAGGTESMSMVPVMGFKTALNYTIAKDNPTYYTSMGLTAEEVSKQYTVKFGKHCLSSPLYRTPVYFMNDYLNHSLETIELVSLFSQEKT